MIKNTIIVSLVFWIVVLSSQQEGETAKDAFLRISNNIYLTTLEITNGEKHES
jgi:hypothetical protein